MYKPAKNTAEIRDLNKKAIIEYLRKTVSATKKDVAQNLNQSFATTSNLCNQLIEEGFIAKESSQNSSGGRIPELFMINGEVKFSCGLNLTQRGFFELAVLNLKNKNISKRKVLIKDSDVFETITEKIKIELFDIMTVKNIPIDNLLGMGVAVPGIYDVKEDILITENFPVYDGQNIRSLLTTLLNIPVYIDNDSNLLALAASRNLNSEKDNLNLIYLFMLEGLGAGIITEGQLLRGYRGFAAEISELPAGLVCSDDKSVILENELSLPGIIGKFNSISGENLPLTMYGWNEFTGKVLQGDFHARKISDETICILSRLLSMLINLFDPEIIFIGGILETIFEYILNDMIDKLTLPSYRDKNKTRFEKGGFYENSIFKGCSELVFNRYSFLN
jgi:predicted NBD/HSP70 family sugar kinase